MDPSKDIKQFVAMKAFLVHGGKVLILRESSKYDDGTNAARYDVPGGRLAPGERYDETLVREIKEETGLTVEFGQPFAVSEWRPIVRGEQWQVVATFVECQAASEDVHISKDHDRYKWIDPTEYRKYQLIPNLVPIFEKYVTWKG